MNPRHTQQFYTHLCTHVAPKLIEHCTVDNNLNSVTLTTRPEHVYDLLQLLRDHSDTQFRGFIDMTATDYPTRDERFEVVYLLQSYVYTTRCTVVVSLDEFTPLSSVVALYPAANWAEREMWDMFGVLVTGHPDLRRLLTDYGFDGHPLRKDFPVSGFVEAKYDSSEKRVCLEDLELSQGYRSFSLNTPWNDKI
jgi:NADH/F420H2 dehydrogenase subunit C